MSSAGPLVYTFTVACLPDHAFQTWTAKIDKWWPKDHSLSGDPDPNVIIEGFVGGRIVERGTDGTEYEWGRITLWEPPAKLAYSWFAGAGPEMPTDVELTFTEQNGKTIVGLVHTGWERFETDGDRWREANKRGWGDSLDGYQRFLARQ